MHEGSCTTDVCDAHAQWPRGSAIQHPGFLVRERKCGPRMAVKGPESSRDACLSFVGDCMGTCSFEGLIFAFLLLSGLYLFENITW